MTPLFAVLGLNQRDALNEYRRLKEFEPERIAGFQIGRYSVHDYRQLEGLRVHDFSISPASVHGGEDFERCWLTLCHSRLMLGHRR